MSSWGKYDNAANAPYWATMTVPTVNAAIAAAPTAANVALLYANTTANAYVTGETIGLFGIDAQEAQVSHPAHTGWVLKTVGQGGRAGRVQYETLVAMTNLIGDGDQQVFANVAIALASLSSKSVAANTSNANSAIFTVSPTLTGNTSATLTYQWQVDNASGSLGWTNVANSTPANTSYTGGTTASLAVYPKDTTANNYVFRVIVTAADEGVTATSSNATITIV